MTRPRAALAILSPTAYRQEECTAVILSGRGELELARLTLELEAFFEVLPQER